MSRQHRLRFARGRDATVAMMVLAAVWGSSMPLSNAQINATWTGAANATWNTSSANWSGGSTLWTAGGNAVFDASGANRAITVSGSQSVANLTVSATGYSFTSGTLGIAPSAAWTIDSDATMSAAIGGTNGFTKSGAGTLTLSGSNAFTGETRVSAGGLTLNNVNALRVSTLNLATGESGTVSFGLSGANTYFIGGLAGGSGRTLDSGTNVLSFGAGNASTSFSGNITATGLVLNGTGSFLFNTGTINLFTSSTSSAPPAFSVQRNATINSDVTITLTSTSGAGTLLPATSSGTLTLGGNVKFVAGAGGNPGVNLLAPLVSSNATVTGSTGNFRVQSLFTVSGGTFEWGGPTASTALQAASSEGFNVIDGATVRGSTVAVGGGRNGLLTVGNGNGTSTLLARNDSNVFQSITFSSGSGQSATLVLNAGGLIDATAVTVSDTTGASIPTVIFNGGTFRARANQPTYLFNVTRTETNPNGTLRIESGGATIDSNGFNVTQTTPFVSGSTSGGGLTKLGSGTLTLAGANTFTGTTRIGAGSLSLRNVLALQNSTLDLDSADSGSLVFGLTGTNTYAIGGLTGSRNIATSGSVVLSVGGNGSSGTYSGAISGGGAFTKVGSGTLVLAGANSFSGNTTVNAGELRIGAGGTTGGLSSSPISVGSGATLAFNRSDNYGGAFAGVISGSGGVRIDSGFLNLTGANSYTGATNVLAGGTLAVNGLLGSGGLTVASGAALMGSGTIGGLTTIAGLHMPGNSPGVETFTNLTYNSGASVQWELWGNTTANSPLAFDQIVVNGDLTFSGATTLALAFTGSASTVAWSNPFWGTNQEWLLYDVAGTTASFGNLTLSTANWQDSTGAFFQTVRPDRLFTVEQRGRDVYIVYAAAVPEPTSLALAGIGVVLATWATVRHRRRYRPAAEV